MSPHCYFRICIEQDSRLKCIPMPWMTMPTEPEDHKHVPAHIHTFILRILAGGDMRTTESVYPESAVYLLNSEAAIMTRSCNVSVRRISSTTRDPDRRKRRFRKNCQCYNKHHASVNHPSGQPMVYLTSRAH
jgi:hypothetical protein